MSDQSSATISFIHFTRKIQNCDGIQLSEWVKEIANIFDKNKEFNLFKQILIKGTEMCYKQISSQIYQEIDQNSPKQIKIDDSISIKDTQNDDDDDEDEDDDLNINDAKVQIICPILATPTDLLCYSFNFLTLNDIISLSKTCRYLFIQSHDPNSIYQITIPARFYNDDFINHYQQHKFSKIKSLIVDRSHLENSKFKSISTKWNKLKSLCIGGSCLPADPSTCGISPGLLTSHFRCLDLTTLKLNVFSPYGHLVSFVNFLQKGFRPVLLQSLYLSSVQLSNDMFIAINQCINLKQLSIFLSDISINKQLFSNMNSKMIKPFKSLIFFETDAGLFDTVIGQKLFTWLMLQSPSLKTVKLDFKWVRNYPTNDMTLILKSLLNIEKLIFSISTDKLLAGLFVDSFSAKFFSQLAKVVAENVELSLNCFELNVNNMDTLISSRSYWVGNAIKMLLKQSRDSILIHYNNNGNMEQFIDWCDAVGMDSFFNSIKIIMSNEKEIFDEKPEKHEGIVENDIKRIFKSLDFLLNLEKEQILNEQMMKLKSIGVRDIVLRIEHNHCYDFNRYFKRKDYPNDEFLKCIQREANDCAKQKSQNGIKVGLEKYKKAMENKQWYWNDDASIFSAKFKINI